MSQFCRTGYERPREDWSPNCYVFHEGKEQMVRAMARSVDITGRVLVELKDGVWDWIGPYGVYEDEEGEKISIFR